MQRGQVLIISLIFMVVILALAIGLLGFVFQNVAATRNALAKEQALQLADAGIDKAIFKLNETAGNYIGETGTVLATGEFDVSVAPINPTRKEITAIGYVPGKNQPKAQKEVRAVVSISATSASFFYGVQVGDGGLVMDNNSSILGNVYSNGPIDGGAGARITGDAFSAGALGRIFDRLTVSGHAHAHQIDTQVIVGGSAFGQIMDNFTVTGSVFANAISNCTISGNAYYTTKSACVVTGTETFPYPGEPDPDPLPLPITDEQINGWREDAEAGGTVIGDYTVLRNQTQSLGPKKITGNLLLEQNATLILTGTIYVAGNITTENNSTVQLDPAYGDDSEVIVSDGIIDIVNNTVFERAGPESYIMMLTTKAGIDVFRVANNSDSLIAYASVGEVVVQNNAILREVTGYRIKLNENASVTYESGLANVDFSGGPGASWGIVRGTWREIK